MRKGIDISYANAGINFDEIAKKYDFVIIRAGYTGWGDGITSHKDDYFEDFYNQAKKRNLGVGCYFYSCANNSQKGENEARFLYENCLKGKQFDYPIFMDVENEQHQTNNRRGVTDAIISFGDYLEKLGYYVSIYANLNFFRNHILTNDISRFDKWVAFPDSGELHFEFGAYGMWQNSWNGNIQGIKTDTDIAYYDYPNIIKTNKLNGYNEQENNIKQENNTISYVIKQGDFLSTIAENHGVTIDSILNLNPQINNPDLIYAGDTILIPLGIKQTTHKLYHIIQKGENLTMISNRYNVTIDSILNLNPQIKNPNLIFAGDKIRIK